MAAPMEQPEQRDGWLIVQAGDRWRACRQGALSTWELAYGCRSMIFADSRGELDLLLLAEKVKADMVDLCSRLVGGIGEAAEKRRAEVTE